MLGSGTTPFPQAFLPSQCDRLVPIPYPLMLSLQDSNGKKVWEFDKRYFTDKGLPDPVPWPPEGKVGRGGGGKGRSGA